MLSELGTHYFSIALDSSNHKTTKLFPIVIRYFVGENGIQVRLLDLQALPAETAEEVYQWILKMLQKHGLKFERIVAFCADNTAANFGSAEHRGENNVFYKLKAHKNNLIPVGCPAHVLHNAAKRGADNLPIDIESIVFKLTSHFKNSTKRTTLDYIDKWFRLERFPKSISWVGLDENEAQLPNLYVLISKVFAIPVSNAFVERVFSLCGSLRQPTCTWFHSSDEQTHCIFQCNGNRKCSNSHVIPPPSLSPGGSTYSYISSIEFQKRTVAHGCFPHEPVPMGGVHPFEVAASHEPVPIGGVQSFDVAARNEPVPMGGVQSFDVAAKRTRAYWRGAAL
ncbi:hypothetical protein niasHT_018741 [Heterodera trifolii]|uniref:HAT C-terminal dimerisation domain-containing protein n=1 Tax=Heterodera trifolii TaxID=157864 RepID=A0ABD2LBC6_9BILA